VTYGKVGEVFYLHDTAFERQKRRLRPVQWSIYSSMSDDEVAVEVATVVVVDPR